MILGYCILLCVRKRSIAHLSLLIGGWGRRRAASDAEPPLTGRGRRTPAIPRRRRWRRPFVPLIRHALYLFRAYFSSDSFDSTRFWPDKLTTSLPLKTNPNSRAIKDEEILGQIWIFLGQHLRALYSAHRSAENDISWSEICIMLLP